MRFLISILKSSLLAAMLLSTPIIGESVHKTYMYNHLGKSVVMIKAGRSGGTGFRVETPQGNRYILTNRHICEAPKVDPFTATTHSGNVHTINKIEVSKVHDLCIMDDIGEIPALKLAASTKLKQTVYLLGHPGLRALTLQSGDLIGSVTINVLTTCSEEMAKQLKISLEELEILNMLFGLCMESYDADHINAISYGGNSGSPVLNVFGNVVGVLFAGAANQPTASFIVPLSYVSAFLWNK